MASVVLAFVSLPSSSCDRQFRTTSISVVDQSTGCFHHLEYTAEFVLEDGRFVSLSEDVPEEFIEGIVQLVLTSRESRETLLDRLGITRESVANDSVRDDILKAATRGLPASYCEVPPDLQPLFEYENIGEVILSRMTGPTYSTTQVLFSVAFHGEQTISVSSACEHPFMLPWTVSVGDQTWETYSPAIPKALSILADPAGPNASLLDGARYVAIDLWSDPDVWFWNVGMALNEWHSLQLAQTLDGFAELDVEFVVESADHAYFSPYEECLSVDLRVRDPAWITTVHCYLPAPEGKLSSTWLDVLPVYRDALAAAERHGVDRVTSLLVCPDGTIEDGHSTGSGLCWRLSGG